jgi:hypothetical protein
MNEDRGVQNMKSSNEWFPQGSCFMNGLNTIVNKVKKKNL